MPIALTCGCGKMFKVKDELAGGQVNCQVCGSALAVPAASAVAETPAVRVVAPPLAARPESAGPQAKPGASLCACPSCSEAIPSNARQCPFCDEIIQLQMSEEEQKNHLVQLLRSIREQDLQRAEVEARSRGGFMAQKSIVLGSLAVLGIASILVGALASGLEGLIALGVFLVLIFGIAALVSLSNDYGAAHIQDAPSAEKAFRRYFMSMKTARYSKAYYALAPLTRENAPVEPLKLAKLPSRVSPRLVNDLSSYQEYVQSIFRGTSSNTRMVQLKKTRVVADHGDFAVVESEVEFSGYPTLLLLVLLLSLLLGIILILVMTKKETWVTRKLLIRHEGRWYIADPGYESAIDRVAARATAEYQ